MYPLWLFQPHMGEKVLCTKYGDRLNQSHHAKVRNGSQLPLYVVLDHHTRPHYLSGPYISDFCWA